MPKFPPYRNTIKTPAKTMAKIAIDLDKYGDKNIGGINVNAFDIPAPPPSEPTSSAYCQVVTVAKCGGDFDNIQDAIDSITDATENVQYIILVYPGEYTVIDNIDVDKDVSIIGFGREFTKIICITDAKRIFDITSDNVTIQDLSIDVTASSCYAISVDGSGGANLTDIFIRNVEITMHSHSGIQRGIYIKCASAEIWDTTINITSSDNSVYGIYFYTTVDSEVTTTLKCYSVDVTCSCGGGTGRGIYVYDNGSVEDAKAFLYNCSFETTESAAATSRGGHTSGADAYIYAFNCLFNGTDDDVFASASSIFTLIDCTLINGTTSAAGTITYAGRTVVNELYAESNILIANNGEIRFRDNGNYVGFEAPALGADQIWVLPNADGANGEFIKTDGAGNLSFGAASVSGTISKTASTTVDTNAYVDIDCGAIADTAVDHVCWIVVETLDGCYHAENRPRAPVMGGVSFMWKKDSGNLKVRVWNDSGSIKTVRAFYSGAGSGGGGASMGLEILFIKALTQAEGDLHLSDAVNWNESKALIKEVRVDTTSTDWDLFLLQNDNGFVADDANIPMLQLMASGSGDANIALDVPYEDEDDSKEVHLYYRDNSGAATADIYIIGLKAE